MFDELTRLTLDRTTEKRKRFCQYINKMCFPILVNWEWGVRTARGAYKLYSTECASIDSVGPKT